MNASRRQWLLALEAVPIGGLAVRFFVLMARNKILYYVHPRWVDALLVGWTLIFVLCAHHVIRRSGHSQIGSKVLFALTCVVTVWLVVLPVLALDSSNAAVENPSQMPHAEPTVVVLPENTDDRTYAYWFDYFSSGTPRPELEGKSFHAPGYVASYDAQHGTFELARTVITCCTADGFKTSFTVVPSGDAKSVPMVSDEWYDVRGTWHKQNDGSWAIIATAVTPTVSPADPYVYP